MFLIFQKHLVYLHRNVNDELLSLLFRFIRSDYFSLLLNF